MAPLQVEFVSNILPLDQQQGNASTSSFPLDDLLQKEAGNDVTERTEAELMALEDEDEAPQAKKSVSFKARIKLRECLHIKNYTPQEIEECWYNKSDLAEIKEDIYNTRNMIAAGELERDTDDYVRRGSENYVEKESARRARAKSIAREAVFDEQEAQWALGSQEPNYIAHFCRAATHLEVKRAYSVGLRDQMEAEMANMANL